MTTDTQTWDFGTATEYTYDDTLIVIESNTAALIAPYDTNNPTVYPTDTIYVDYLLSFTPTETVAGSDAIKYIFVVNGVDYYYTGGAWVASDGTYTQANTSAELTAAVVSSFTINSKATFTVKAFLHSDDGSTTPTLGSMVLSYEYDGTFITNDYWAIEKGYNSFTAFIAANEFAPARSLNRKRRRAYGIIHRYLKGTIATDDYAYLEDLEYRMIELMFDREQDRSSEQARSQRIPADYLFQRDRDMLYKMSQNSTRRRIGWTT